MANWELPYPIEEQDVRQMCGDPIAVAYAKFEAWLKSKKFKVPVQMEELIDCIWCNTFGDNLTKYEILRNSEYIPECIPDDLWELRKDLFEMRDK